MLVFSMSASLAAGSRARRAQRQARRKQAAARVRQRPSGGPPCARLLLHGSYPRMPHTGLYVRHIVEALAAQELQQRENEVLV